MMWSPRALSMLQRRYATQVIASCYCAVWPCAAPHLWCVCVCVAVMCCAGILIFHCQCRPQLSLHSGQNTILLNDWKSFCKPDAVSILANRHRKAMALSQRQLIAMCCTAGWPKGPLDSQTRGHKRGEG